MLQTISQTAQSSLNSIAQRSLRSDEDLPIPVPPGEDPPPPVQEPPDTPIVEPGSPVHEPGPSEPRRL